MHIPKPPKLEELPLYTQLRAGLGYSTIVGDFDFETYSGAGFIWNPSSQKYEPPLHAKVKGLPSIGAAVYTEHVSAEVLSLAYDLKDGRGKRLWRPGDPPPLDLFAHLANGHLLEAWNVAFERWVWANICVPKYNWPVLPFYQLRDAMAKARAFSIAGGLAQAGDILKITNKKDKDGFRLLTKFSMPRNPTKGDPRHRIFPDSDPSDAAKLYQYNLQDIAAEAEISSILPDLIPQELDFWLCDQSINFRGVQLDVVSAQACLSIIEQAQVKYNQEITVLTDNSVKAASEVARIKKWMKDFANIETNSLDADSIVGLAKAFGLNPTVKRVLEIRQLLGSSAVKKLYSMLNQVTKHGRLHDLFMYHSARTGRAAGQGPQPQNLPNSGPEVLQCPRCREYFKNDDTIVDCPWCGLHGYGNFKVTEWCPAAVTSALTTIATKSLACVEYYWGNAIEVVSGCLRGLFTAKPGYDLICSDYSAIEAVVLAMLAGEQWRIDVFNTHGKIYEMSASKITGIPFQEFLDHKAKTGQHHPKRKTVGKVAELASGYQGWLGAWKAFGADEFMNEDEIKKAILAWRAASPSIVEFWGGQTRGWFPDYFGLEGAAIQAVLSPGNEFSHRGITYIVYQDVLYCRLLSGRHLVYHKPRLAPSDRREGTYSLSFEGWNTNPKYGSVGWVRMNTYGGKLTENVVQATARDILAHAIVNLENKAYQVVLHVHDEIVAEIPENWGSVSEFEEIMSNLPHWAANWPIKANGGWRAKRYAK